MERANKTGGKEATGIIIIIWLIAVFLIGFMVWMWLT